MAPSRSMDRLLDPIQYTSEKSVGVTGTDCETGYDFWSAEQLTLVGCLLEPPQGSAPVRHTRALTVLGLGPLGSPTT